MQVIGSIDSTLSTNDSVSTASTTSLDFEARLAYTSGRFGIGGTNDCAPATNREMTEDEVAVMVRNALRKARRAMNSCSPNVSVDDADGDVPMGDGEAKIVASPSSATESSSAAIAGGAIGDGGETPNKWNNLVSNVSDEVDFASHSSETTGVVGDRGRKASVSGGGSVVSGSGSTKSDLARRIEEEIQSARSYAQKRYFNSVEGDVRSEETETTVAVAAATPLPLSPTPILGRNRSPQSVDTQTTPLVANLHSTASAAEGDDDAPPTKKNTSLSSKADSAKERIARSKDRIAAANERLSRMEVEGKISRSRSPKVRQSLNTDHGGADVDVASRVVVVAEDAGEVEKSTADLLSSREVECDGNAAFAVDAASVSVTPPQATESAACDLIRTDSIKSEIIGVLAPNVQALHASNKPVLRTTSSPSPPTRGETTPVSPPPNTNSTNKPRHHRQVLFRHPYPLPPPPPLPRGDAAIISAHYAPEKDVHVRWVCPDTDLKALIEAVGEEENLIRKSNACGAIKVLASKESNQPKLCRTTGLLDVLVRACWDDAVDSDALDARTRAVTTLLYLSEPKDNRLIVARHPRALEVLVKVVQEDTGEARWRATSALATLAKTPGNRVLMGDSEKLATVLGGLMVVDARKGTAEEAKDEEKCSKDASNKIAPGIIIEDDGTLTSSRLHGKDSPTTRGDRSFDTADDSASRMLTSTYSGTETFTDASGMSTHTDDDRTYESAEFDDYIESDDDMDSRASRDSYEEEEGSVEEEEGFEMQISSLKKLNIENASDFLAKSQLSACATLTHLTKHCANATKLCKNEQLLDCIILLAGLPDNPLHTRCIEMLCNFSRFPSNNARLASNPKCVLTLLNCGKSKSFEDRVWAIRTIQNMCSDASSKVSLATGAMLSVLSTAAMRKDYDEQFAAVGALMNLSTEPGSIVPLTNTKTVVATLVHLAHSPNTPSSVRKIACDSLATIGLWLQTLASAGTVPEEIPFSPLPTHSATGWLRWESA